MQTVVPRIHRSRSRPLAEAAFLIAWLGLFLVAEMWGRRDSRELTILGWSVIFVVAVGWTAAYHLRLPMSLIDGLWLRMRRVWHRLRRSWSIAVGVDFRGRPHVRRGVPGILWKPTTICIAAALLLYTLRSVGPVALREQVARISWLAAMFYTVLLWCAALLGTVAMMVLVHGHLHDRLVRTHAGRGPRPLRKEGLLHSGAIGLWIAIAAYSPVRAPLWIAGSAFTLMLIGAASPLRPRLALLWKYSDRSEPQRSLSVRVIGGAQVVALASLGAVILLGLRGAEWSRITIHGAEIGSSLGFVFAWAFALGGMCLLVRLGGELALAWFHDPGRPARVQLRLTGATPRHRRGRRRLRRTLRGLGLDVRFSGDPPRRLESILEVQEESEGAQPKGAPAQSTPVEALLFAGAPRTLPPCTMRALHDPEQIRRLRRRFDVRCRRVLFRSLRTLFKRASRRKYASGEGYWLGLQHWFILGMSRDRQEEDTQLAEDAVLEDIVGPPYHQQFPQAVRNHFLQVCNALEIDLLFVGDGVGFKRLRSVLEILFERYDVHNGQSRAEEHWFVGIPGARVILHEFDLDQTRVDRGYPEPDYEDVGRARVLQIYRSRGESEELSLDPVDRDRIPVLHG